MEIRCIMFSCVNCLPTDTSACRRISQESTPRRFFLHPRHRQCREKFRAHHERLSRALIRYGYQR